MDFGSPNKAALGTLTAPNQYAATQAESPVPATVGTLLSILVQQAAELRSRSAGIAAQIVGTQPEAGNPKDRPPASLIDVLQGISGELSWALCELERVQSRL